MNDRLEGDNFFYLNEIARGWSGNGNICEILDKIPDDQRMSAENIWVNTIYYLIVSIKYD